MDSKKILAKSSPDETIFEHSVKTLNIAEDLLNKTGVVDECLHDITLIAATLHDIGKCTEDFQRHIIMNEKANLAHNVISFKIVDEFVSIEDKDIASPIGIGVGYAKDVVMKSILHHHPIPVDIDKYNTELSEMDCITDEDINNANSIIDTIIETLNPKLKIYKISKRKELFKIPSKEYSYFKNLTNSFFNSLVNVSNGIVRFADILASGGGEIESYTDFTFDSSSLELKKPEGYDDRFFKHLEYADKMTKDQIFELFGPTGFGKTMIYVLWLLKQNKKVCCVSPTNEIAISNYNSVMKELKALGLDKIVKVGLLLTNEWKSGEELKDKNDIVITNIDNYTRPLFKCDERKPMCFNFNNSNVVFDEYQQYATKPALEAIFKIALLGRYLCTNSKTILTSATPNKYLYEDIKLPKGKIDVKKITVDYTKYGEKKYKCEFRQFNPDKDTENFLMVVNSVKTSQNMCKSGWINYHTLFTKKDKEEKRELLNKTHGKESSIDDRKIPVVSTNIISTGIDISFKKVILCGLPMEETTQLAGRCNRWNEYPDGGILVFSKQIESRSEDDAINAKYNTILRNKEYDMLKEKIGDRTITLNELYSIVEEIKNDEEYDKLFKAYMKECDRESCKNLSKMEYTYSGEKIDSDEVIISDKHTIRTTESERENEVSIFVTVPGCDGYIQKNYMNKNTLHKEHLDYMYHYIRDKKLYKKYGNHERLYTSGGTMSLNDKYIKLAKHSSTPYILNPKQYIYTKEKGLQKLSKK